VKPPGGRRPVGPLTGGRADFGKLYRNPRRGGAGGRAPEPAVRTRAAAPKGTTVNDARNKRDAWDEHVEELVEKHESGMGYKTIAAEYDGLSWQQVRRRIKNAEREE